MGAWVAVVGCALLVLTLFDEVARLRTVEYRDAIDDFLSTPPGNGLGLESTQVVELMHWLMLFSGAVAAAALVLAVYVLQRSRAARVGYTIAAVAIVLTAPVSGGLAPVLVAFAAIMLWTKPARDWFAGVPAKRPRASDRATGQRTPNPRVEGSVMSSESDSQDQPEPRMPEDPAGRPTPPPTQGFGTPVAGQQGAPGQPGPSYPPGYPAAGPAGQPPHGEPPHYGQQPSYGQPPPYGYPPQPYPYGGPSRPMGGAERPVTVTAAAWITWALSGLTILFFVLMGLFLAVAGDQVMDQVRDELAKDPNFQDFDVATDQVLAAFWVMAVLMVFWAVVAIVLGWFAYRGVNWARITLVVSSSVALLVSLATFPVGLLHTLGAGAVIALLFAGGANDWYARGGGSKGPGQFGGYPRYGNQPGYTGAAPPQQSYAPPGQQGQPPGQPTDRPTAQPTDRPTDRPDGPSSPKKDEPPSNVW